MGEQLKLFEDRDIDRTGVESIRIIGWDYNMPMDYHVVPVVFRSDYYIAKRRLSDGFPVEILVKKIKEDTYAPVKEKLSLKSPYWPART